MSGEKLHHGDAEYTEYTENHFFGETTVSSEPDVCDVCGSTNILEIKCKVICQNCGTILRSCSDL